MIPSCASIVVVATVAVVASVACINAESYTCYQCTSSTNNDCDDPFKSSSTMSTCTGEQCTKSIYSMSVLGTSKTVITRSCKSVSTNTNNCQSESIAGVSGTSCTCTGNNCNTAVSGLVSSHGTAILAGLCVVFTLVARTLM